jgi:hypothetical protein
MRLRVWSKLIPALVLVSLLGFAAVPVYAADDMSWLFYRWDNQDACPGVQCDQYGNVLVSHSLYASFNLRASQICENPSISVLSNDATTQIYAYVPGYDTLILRETDSGTGAYTGAMVGNYDALVFSLGGSSSGTATISTVLVTCDGDEAPGWQQYGWVLFTLIVVDITIGIIFNAKRSINHIAGGR